MWNIVNNKRLPIILMILSLFIIIGMLFLIIFNPVARGYEISIYDAFPWYFWFLILLSVMISLLIIFFDFIKGKKINKNQCLFGILIIVFISFIILLLPYFRGYATYGREDHLSHIGTINEIISNGKINNNDFYPNYHVLTAITSKISGASILNLSTFFPRIFPFIFLIIFVVFSRLFLINFDFRLLFIFILPLFFFSSLCNYLAPYYQSFLLIPIILFLYFKRNRFEKDLRYNILFIIILIGYIMYHPLNTILLMIIFLVSIIVYLYSKKYTTDHSFEKSLFNQKTIFIPFVLAFVIFSEWYLSFFVIKNDIRNAFFSIFYGSGVSESKFSSQLSILQNYSVLLEDLIKVGIFKYGLLVIFSFLSFFSILYLLIEFRKKNGFKLPKAEILFFSLIISGLLSLTILSFMFSSLLGWGRYFIWVIFFSILILSISLEIWFNKKNERKKNLLKSFFVMLVVFLILFISLFSFYGSPLVMDVNQQVTEQEIVGFKFLLEKRDVNDLIDEIGISQSRYYDAFHNLNTSSTNIRRYDTSPPDNFGYNITHNLGSLYSSDTYLIISKMGTIQYPSKYPNNPEVWIFSDKDFDLMLEDKTVDRIYTTDFEFDIFIINSDN